MLLSRDFVTPLHTTVHRMPIQMDENRGSIYGTEGHVNTDTNNPTPRLDTPIPDVRRRVKHHNW